MNGQNIRIRLKAFDHRILDASTREIVNTAYALPEKAIHLGRTIHVPGESLPSPAAPTRRPIGAVFLLRHRPGLDAPDLRELGAAEASARLYVTALNLLAHHDHGLDAVVRVAEHAPCFALDSADLASTCALIRSVVAEAHLTGP